MKCPRCNYEWDVRQSVCPYCHLHIRTSSRPGSVRRMVPVQESTSGDQIVSSPPPSNEKATRMQSSHQIEQADQKSAQHLLSARPNEPQLPKFPITDRLNTKKSFLSTPNNTSLANAQKTPSLWGSSTSGIHMDIPQSQPGTLLHRDRYCLQNIIYKQKWPLGIVETQWSAFDTRLAQAPVIISQLSIPGDAPQEAQVISYTATKVFTSIGRNPHIAALRDVFSDKGHNFFVFEAVEGLSLPMLISNSGGKLPEPEVITCCLQIVELLDVCSRQVPPLVHGNIRPEYIVRKPANSQYVLTNFSVARAGGLAEIVTNMEDGSTSAYSSMMRAKMDGRTDLSTLLELAYYMVAGWKVADTSNLEIDPALSPQFRALLSQGLAAPIHQRYQIPAQLYQDLLTLQNIYNNKVSTPRYNSLDEHSTLSPTRPFNTREQSVQSSPSTIQTTKSESKPENFIVPTLEKQFEYTLLVPPPEELPPLKYTQDMRNAVLWFTGMLFLLLLFLGRGLM